MAAADFHGDGLVRGESVHPPASDEPLLSPRGLRSGTTQAARIGIGHDTHRLTAGGPLRLGGVDVPHDHQAEGHSDADVLLHALVDALLGAAAAGDIGELFPDDDPANRDRDSADFVRAAKARIDAAKLAIVNLDCIVFAQRPKLSGHKDAIRQRIGELLELNVDRVGLKAKTGEGVGPVGREEAIEAQVIALLEPWPA